MNKKEIKLAKHSALIQMSNKITAVQRKALNAMIYFAKKQLREKSPVSYSFIINADILLEAIGLGEENYKYLKEHLEELQRIRVSYNLLDKDKTRVWGSFVILAGFEYKDGVITYSFPHQIMDAIIDPNIYAYIDLVIVKGLKSKYSIALYELLQDYVNLHPPKMTIKQFRELMGVEEGKYKTTVSMLRKNVIERAANEINENDKIDFAVDYELKKTRRTISHIIFHVRKKNITNNYLEDLEMKVAELSQETETETVKYSPELIEFIKKAVDKAKHSDSKKCFINELEDKKGDKHYICVNDKGQLYDGLPLPEKIFTLKKAKDVWERLYRLSQQNVS